jgi:predicted GIY-YIG superfamily endonuclease
MPVGLAALLGYRVVAIVSVRQRSLSPVDVVVSYKGGKSPHALEVDMHPGFASHIESLHPSFERLLAMEPHAGLPPPTKIPVSGVYLFSEGDEPLYVGRSNRLRKRYFLHTRPGSQHNQASFAFRIAAKILKLPAATYTKARGRKAISRNDDFIREFTVAKERIRKMNYRFVEETDQTRQALLEIYVAVALGTPYNDFGTH